MKANDEMADLQHTLLRRISKLNKRWRLIEPGDRVMVACSGGKDSWSLLHLLRAYRDVVPFSYDLVAVNVDQGHPGFPADLLARHFERHGFEYRIVFEDTYSVVQARTPPDKTHCSLCSRMRRGILHKVAAEVGATKIALGHHRDDAVHTVLLSMMYAGQIRSMPPILPAAGPGECAVIRPVAACCEDDLARYAALVEAPIIPCNLCGSQPNARRARVKRLLDALETEDPGILDSLFASLAHVRGDSLYDPALRGDEAASRRTLPLLDASDS